MISLSEKAVLKVNEIMEEQGKVGHNLRMYVQGGGCSGLQYGLTFTKEQDGNDSAFPFQGFQVLVDPISFQYLSGTHVDYIESMMGGGFKIENPNAARSCGCGSSFSV
jgi:iron-sulfur cluster assembly accessory protein